MMPVRGATVKRIVQNVQKMEVWTRAAAEPPRHASKLRGGAGGAGEATRRHTADSHATVPGYPATVAEGDAG